MNDEDIVKVLRTAGVLFDEDDEMGDGFWLNMNDVFGWGIADTEQVPADKLKEVWALFLAYGMAGLYYWVSEQRQQCQSEFSDINREIQFVREEMKIALNNQNAFRKPYVKAKYIIEG